MNLIEIDPLRDPRWSSFVCNHQSGSVFHTTGWLEALRLTYGYRPAALAVTDSDGALVDSLVFCRVDSWVTGRRIVSLPFSDHCEPLVANEKSRAHVIAALADIAKKEDCKYVELRPAANWESSPVAFESSQSFYLHRLDLRTGADAVFRGFHRDCIQRKIRRAERENLVLEVNTAPETVESFYRMVLRTRRRQGLPPQPIAWFRNLVTCLGESLTIRLARKNNEPIAGLVTLKHRNGLVYKYGASDERFHNFGGMPFLFWRTIQDTISSGLHELDLGRSEPGNSGLIAFKEHLGATRSSVVYWRSPATSSQPIREGSWQQRLARQVCSHIPDTCLTRLGDLFYRDIA